MGWVSKFISIFSKVSIISRDLSSLYDKAKEAVDDEEVTRDELLDLLREVMDIIDKFRSK